MVFSLVVKLVILIGKVLMGMCLLKLCEDMVCILFDIVCSGVSLCCVVY